MGLRSYPKVYFKLLLIGFVMIFGMGLSTSFLSILAVELDPSGVLAGLVVSAWFLSRVFIEFPSGIISDRVGRYRLLVLGLGLGSFGALLCGLSNSIYTLIIGRAVWGLGAALYFMNNVAMILDLFDLDMRGRALGTFQAIEFIGPVFSTPIGGFIVVRLEDFLVSPYNLIFYIAAALSFCAFVMSFVSRDVRQVGNAKSSESNAPLREVLPALRNWGLIVVCINAFSRLLIMQGINNTVLELFLKGDIGLSEDLIGIVITTRTVGHIVATVIAGYLSDRIGRKPVIAAGMIVEGAAMFIYTTVSQFEHFILTALLAGFGEGMVFICLIVLLSEVVSNRVRGGAIGLYRTFMDIGGSVGPILFMSIYGGYGSAYAFYLVVVLLIANALLAVTVRVKVPKESR